MVYDELNRMVSQSVDLSNGQSIVKRFQYDRKGRLVRTIEPEGNFHEIEYSPRNLVLKTIRGASDTSTSTTTRFAYNENGNLRYIYDDDGDFDPAGTPTELIYDGFGRVSKTIDENRNYSTVRYNAASQTLEQASFNSAGKVLSHSMMDYDVLGRVYQALIDGFGDTPTDTPSISIIGTPSPQLASMQGTWINSLVSYDKRSLATYAINAKGQEIRSLYDNLGRLTESESLDPSGAGSKASYEYDDNSNIIKSTLKEYDSSGTSDTYNNFAFYDNLNRLVATVNDLGNTTRYMYDSRNNVTHISDAQNPDTVQTNTLPGTMPTGAPVTINARGNTMVNHYDDLSRLIKTEKHIRYGGIGKGAVKNTVTTSQEWDLNSRLTSVVDGNQNRTAYRYDHQNRIIQTVFPDGTRNQITYNRAGDIVSARDARDVVQIFAYDKLGRVTRKDFRNLPYGANQTTYENFTYDGLSRLTTAENNYASSEFSYNSFGNLINERQTIHLPSTSLTKDFSSTYDVLGNRSTFTADRGGNHERTLNYTRDYFNRIKKITDNSTSKDILTNTFTGSGYRREKVAYGNNTSLYLQYDDIGRPTRWDYRPDASGSTRIAGFTYIWDKVGNRKVERSLDLTSDPNETAGKGSVYNYDSLYRLEDAYKNVQSSTLDTYYQNSATMFTPSTFESKASYDLDKLGNRNKVTKEDSASGSTSIIPYDQESGGQTFDSEMNRYTYVNNVRQNYDREGNLTQDGQKSYWYDYGSRLTQYINYGTGKETRYAYDVLGRRVYKQKDVSGTTSYVLYWYDGDEVVLETDESDNFKREFIYASGIDNVVQMRVVDTEDLDGDGDTKDILEIYYHTNSIGSVVALTDASGTVVERYDYTAFGEVTIYAPDGTTERAKSKVGNPYYFQGRRLDTESGLYFFRARYYDAGKGRFLQRDPLGYVDGMNLYQAFGGNPVNFVDPWGENKVTGQKRKDLEELADFYKDYGKTILRRGKKSGNINQQVLGGNLVAAGWKLEELLKSNRIIWGHSSQLKGEVLTVGELKKILKKQKGRWLGIKWINPKLKDSVRIVVLNKDISSSAQIYNLKNSIIFHEILHIVYPKPYIAPEFIQTTIHIHYLKQLREDLIHKFEKKGLLEPFYGAFNGPLLNRVALGREFTKIIRFEQRYRLAKYANSINKEFKWLHKTLGIPTPLWYDPSLSQNQKQGGLMIDQWILWMNRWAIIHYYENLFGAKVKPQYKWPNNIWFPGLPTHHSYYEGTDQIPQFFK